VNEGVALRFDERVECVWGGLKDCLLQAADEICGKTKGPLRHKESWWWNEEIDALVREKQRLFREMKRSNTIENQVAYCNVKMETKNTIATAQAAERKRFTDILETENEKENIFRVAKHLIRKNRDIVGGACCEGREGEGYCGGQLR